MNARNNTTGRTSQRTTRAEEIRTGSRGGSARSTRPRTNNRTVSRNRAHMRMNAASPKRRHTFRIIGIAALVLVLLGAGTAFGYYQLLSNNLHDGIDPELRQALQNSDVINEPFYMLLMGTDGSSERDASGDFGSQYRSDSIILVRIDPIEKKVAMVSLLRDTLVDLGEYGEDKLNAAHAYGGSALSVKAASDLAGVPISHFAELNFDGFKDIVDALGGVEVDVPMEIDDADAGGHLDAGPQTLNGDQALILCRSRHAYDAFGGGDAYRAANQRLVLSAIAKKMLSSDPATMVSTVQALSNYVTTDLEITDILALAQTMRGLNPVTDITSGTIPTDSEYINGVWYEVVDETAWKKMMDRVNQALSPTEEDVVDQTSGTILASAGSGNLSNEQGDLSGGNGRPRRSGTVAIRNGNGISGAGLQAASEIEKLGYQIDSGNADSFDYKETLVVYPDGDAQGASRAQEIVDALGVGKVTKNNNTFLFEGDYLVVLGADWSKANPGSSSSS